MESRLAYFKKIAESLYPPLTASDGVKPAKIELAEQVYGFRLPGALREFYLLAGNHEAISFSHNRLLSVNCLEIEGKRLIFYEENQGVCFWAIDLADVGKDDPPVWQGQSIDGRDELDWHRAADRLSDFLLVMLGWQSVMGGLAVTGLAERVDEKVAEKAESLYTPLEVGENASGLEIYTAERKVICLSRNEKGTTIDAGAGDAEKFREITDALGINWDYCSLDD